MLLQTLSHLPPIIFHTPNLIHTTLPLPLLMLRILRAYNINISFPPNTLHPNTPSALYPTLQKPTGPTMHPSHSFFTLLRTFIPRESSGVSCLTNSSPGLFSNVPSSPVDALHVPCNDPVCVFRSETPLEPVLSARAVHVAHIGRVVRNGVNTEVGWR